MPKVLNKLNKQTYIPLDVKYVGRPSEHGNPYKIGASFADKILNRKDCVIMFKEYAEERLKRETTWLESLRGKDLVCWCHDWDGQGDNPMYCHADVLLELANKVEVTHESAAKK